MLMELVLNLESQHYDNKTGLLRNQRTKKEQKSSQNPILIDLLDTTVLLIFPLNIVYYQNINSPDLGFLYMIHVYRKLPLESPGLMQLFKGF